MKLQNFVIKLFFLLYFKKKSTIKNSDSLRIKICYCTVLLKSNQVFYVFTPIIEKHDNVSWKIIKQLHNESGYTLNLITAAKKAHKKNEEKEGGEGD